MDIACLRNGRFDGTQRSDLRACLAAARSQERRLVVHFHGGLVSRQRGLATAARIGPIYEEVGGQPLSFVWQSGLGETLVNGLSDIGHSRLFKRLRLRVMQFVLGNASGSGSGEGVRGFAQGFPPLDRLYAELDDSHAEPYAYLGQDVAEFDNTQQRLLATFLRNDTVVQEESATLKASFARSADTVQERSAVATAALVGAVVAATKRVHTRLRSGRGHGLYPTVVEELLRALYVDKMGIGVWRQMKSDSDNAFGADEERCAGTALVRELALAADPDQVPLLVGHSTGAIWICRLLAHAGAQLPSGYTFDVALLAPACSFELFEQTLAKHRDRVRRLRLFCMHDEREINDTLVPGVYPRSLLYFVSGVLEDAADWPLLGMHRFHHDTSVYNDDAFQAIAGVRTALADRGDSTVWSIATGRAGLESAATHHGDFDDDALTLKSVQHMLQSH